MTWFRPDGKEMSDDDWGNQEMRCLGLRLAGDAIEAVDARGNRIVDDTLLLLLNAYHETISFVLPAHKSRLRWERLLDTREDIGQRRHPLLRGGGRPYTLGARSLSLFRLR